MSKSVKNENARDLIERALWTAVQAGLAAWAVTGYKLDKVAAIAVAGAALSALKTFIKNTL